MDTLADTGSFSGSTTGTLTLSSARVTDSGTTYKVLVSNIVGSALSSPATLQVTSQGRITAPFTSMQSGAQGVTWQIPDNAQTFRISILDMQGYVVWTKDYQSSSDLNQVYWCSCSNNGNRVHSGIYFLKLQMLDANHNVIGDIFQKSILKN